MRPYWSFLLSAPLALVACGDDDSAGRLADAPPQLDAYVEPDTTVTLTVTYDGAPRAGVHTYFLAPDNSVVATVDTNESGVASAKLPLGGSVTAIDPFPRRVESLRAAAVEVGNNDLRSFLGVKPGDHLTLTQKATTDQVGFQIYAPAVTEPSSASSYDVLTSCGNGQIYPGGGGSGSSSPQPGGYVYLTGCKGKADIIVVARGYVNEEPRTLGVLVKADASVKEGETLDLTDQTYAAPTERTFTYQNPSEYSLQVQHTLVTSKGQFGPFEASTSGAATLGEPVLAGATSIVDTSFYNDGRHHIIDAGALVADYALDFAPLLLRGLTSQPQYDKETKKVTWTESDTGNTADFTLARLEVQASDRQWQWTVAAPYTRGEIVLPVLPTDVATWAPGTDDSVYLYDLINAKATGAYDAVRARALDAYGQSQNDGFASLAVPSGRVVAVQSQQLGVMRPAATVRRAAQR